MFTFSKIFWMVFSPENLLVVALIVGSVLLFTRYARAGRWIVAAAMTIFVLVGVFPVGYRIVEALENRFPANPPLPPHIAGIVVLGGTVNPGLSVARGQPATTDGAERLIEFIHLARRYPEAALIFSGGSGSLSQSDLKETEVAREILNRLGFPDGRVKYENRSRNTHENALYSLERARPAPDDVWILVTSAIHMPRAVGSFRAAGWKRLIPYPVDYTTDGTGSFEIGFGPIGGVQRLALGVREWTGLAAYRILGRTDVLYSGPAPITDN